MGNLITNITVNMTQQKPLGAVSNVDITRTQKYTKPDIQVAPDVTTEDKQQNKHKTKPSKILCQTGLMGAGAILLYLGLRTPSKMKIFKNGVKNKIFRMENAILFFERRIKCISAKAFPETEKAVEEYVQAKHINPQDYIKKFDEVTDVGTIIKEKNAAFETINTTINGEYKGGPSEFDNLANTVRKERIEAERQIQDEAQITRMKLKDFAQIPSFEDKKHEDLIEVARDELAARVDILNKQIDNADLKSLDKATNNAYKKVGTAIEDSRKSAVDTKKQVIDVAFTKVREILGLGDDFVPSYETKYYDLSAYKNIKTKYLRAASIPNEIVEAYPKNQYLTMLEQINFNKLTRSEVAELYKTVTPENNLTELRFLIDGLRMEEAVAEANGSKNAKILSTMIEKLKYLSNEFQMIGNDVLYEKCMQDFSKIKPKARGVKLYDIYNDARKLGFNTIFELDNYFVKLYNNDNHINISKYIEHFRANPEKYI